MEDNKNIMLRARVNVYISKVFIYIADNSDSTINGTHSPFRLHPTTILAPLYYSDDKDDVLDKSQ